jgi:hypothetical protein
MPENSDAPKRPRRPKAGYGRRGADGYYGSGFDDLPEPSRTDAPRLGDEVRALDCAIERMKAKPRYEETALALLQARRRNLVSQLAAADTGLPLPAYLL